MSTFRTFASRAARATAPRPLKRPLLNRTLLGGVAALTLAATAACATATAGTSTASSSATATSSGTPATSLRLGYFANVTHATALVGVGNGIFQGKLGKTKLTTTIFNAGPDEMTALLAGQLDAAFVGPSSALNAWIQDKHSGLTIVAGAEDAGAELVVSSSITSASQLKGTTLADPQLGNTQDVALRYWLKQQGYNTNLQGGGDVSITPTSNSTVVSLFGQGKIQGAWVPEPYASELVQAGGHVLVDEKTLWPGGNFATTNLVVANSYLAAHPQTVEELIEGEIEANNYIDQDSSQAQTVANQQLQTLTGKALPTAVLTRAWGEQSVTANPFASSLQTELNHAVSDGLLTKTSLKGIFNLTLLNQALKAEGDPTVSSDGLGPQ
ncbi:MAG TPA: ABC transporter substrate-binding protein [Actinocrinis sp.]|jgi:NitT/TauT family transport system substrate-binding protein